MWPYESRCADLEATVPEPPRSALAQSGSPYEEGAVVRRYGVHSIAQHPLTAGKT